MSMKTIKWRLDIVGAENDPLAVAKDAARYMQAEALSQLYEVTDAEGNRFHVDLESETVTEIGVRLATDDELGVLDNEVTS